VARKPPPPSPSRCLNLHAPSGGLSSFFFLLSMPTFTGSLLTTGWARSFPSFPFIVPSSCEIVPDFWGRRLFVPFSNSMRPFFSARARSFQLGQTFRCQVLLMRSFQQEPERQVPLPVEIPPSFFWVALHPFFQFFQVFFFPLQARNARFLSFTIRNSSRFFSPDVSQVGNPPILLPRWARLFVVRSPPPPSFHPNIPCCCLLKFLPDFQCPKISPSLFLPFTKARFALSPQTFAQFMKSLFVQTFIVMEWMAHQATHLRFFLRSRDVLSFADAFPVLFIATHFLSLSTPLPLSGIVVAFPE